MVHVSNCAIDDTKIRSISVDELFVTLVGSVTI